MNTMYYNDPYYLPSSDFASMKHVGVALSLCNTNSKLLMFLANVEMSIRPTSWEFLIFAPIALIPGINYDGTWGRGGRRVIAKNYSCLRRITLKTRELGYDRTIPLNDVVKRLDNIYQTTPKTQRNPSETLEIIKKIRLLDNEGYQLLSTYSFPTRLLWVFRRLFGNWKYNRNAVLYRIEQECLQSIKLLQLQNQN